MTTFSSSQPLLEMVKLQKDGGTKGIYSVCSANPLVMEACMQQAADDRTPLLIESTCNQVNQFGGYTGLRPADFTRTVADIAGRMDYSTDQLILGGDHLGPYPWRTEPADIAMTKARHLVQEIVRAGYTKIHIDTSMTCLDDPPGALDPGVCARRSADLCLAAEEAAQEGNLPIYVIGTEVPVPGGEKANSVGPQVTSPEEASQTIELFHRTLIQYGLESAWERVIALVVQPGVEFSDTQIYEYNRPKASFLSKKVESIPGIIFEAHSTDYQQPPHLRQMVEDHFAILKVGPGLTFAMREAIFALAMIEKEWLGENGSNILAVVEKVMLAEPQYWQPYYPGSEEMQAFSRKYSLSDRIRYYWQQPELQQALNGMIQNLSLAPIPRTLLSQYLPDLYCKVREGSVINEPRALIHARVRRAVAGYADACLG